MPMGFSLYFLVPHEGHEEDDTADDERTRVFGGRAEVLGIHQHQGGRGEQTHHRRAEACKYGLYGRMLLILQEELADGEHQDERREHHGKGGDDGAPHTARGREAYVGGRVDADGAGGHLADGHDVRKLLRRQPVVARHDLALYHGEHGIAASEAEQSYLEERVK